MGRHVVYWLLVGIVGNAALSVPSGANRKMHFA